jgi:hypothetical protein
LLNVLTSGIRTPRKVESRSDDRCAHLWITASVSEHVLWLVTVVFGTVTASKRKTSHA